MKLSKREIFMLIVLAIAIVGIGYHNFIVQPRLEKIEQIRLEADDYARNVKDVKEKLLLDKKFNQEFKSLNAQIYLMTSRLFPSLEQEKIIVILDKMIVNSDINPLSINFSELETGSIDRREPYDQNDNTVLKSLAEEFNKSLENNTEKSENSTEKSRDKENDSKEENTIKKMSVNINFIADYENILEFLSEIESSDKEILINSLSFSSNDEEKELAGTISLDFYSVAKLHNQDEEYLSWDITGLYGRENPFVPYEGYVNTFNYDYTRNKYDFLMTLKPISSDLPTVILSKTKDYEGESYIFADNHTIEEVEFQVLKDNDKYYYKYKTQQESYPLEYDDKMVEFKPESNKILLHIISNKRNSSEDKSGVNLTLVNKTDLKLKVVVHNEDKLRPRLKIVKKEGNIEVDK